MGFTELLALADKALSLLTEGRLVAIQLASNYESAKDTLTTDQQSQLDAKLQEVEAKSAEVHADIQGQA